MKSLGVIETRGLVAAVQAVDAACKAAGVACIGYRKVGSGLVSVCFEGEISAIHTAIERGVAVAKTVDSQVKSLVIARPERCVVEALSSLKGHPPRAKAQEKVHAEPAVEPQIPAVEPTPLSPIVDEKNAVHKKGKKA
ncbi:MULTISPECIES: BMC domain-containing protein [Enterobacteriaceae]|uniref:BMC domain-containing protein n=1 Tax=Enterobacteriaceae TaxID=543 RepID=UPI0015DD3020|nr:MULTISPECIES: BMC domain-containing protein [unclassified Klebsiella]HAT3955037.1 BMC domain-containing protein [Kluyvera ascorbata]BBR58345.1 microcompartment protein [Klebsiella sp. WP4-W18-ESBL-05]BBS92363.1 microcompartment protein [Klebsiella sp. WP7-S18-CRE-02]BBS97393.1 microcompartment protein [Klebsiella sp. WP7-S18-CRE-03]BBT02460.1 microcompartment protein [Klebsiella sp. WP7-S18-ESBL-04]